MNRVGSHFSGKRLLLPVLMLINSKGILPIIPT